MGWIDLTDDSAPSVNGSPVIQPDSTYSGAESTRRSPTMSTGLGGLGGFGGMDIISGGLGLIGGILQNNANRDIARETNQMSQANAREQMQFQERMSNTSYQRGMADMKKAGLNPMLAFSQGGASSPSGAAGSVQSAHMENVISPALSTAMQASQFRENLENTKSQTKVNEALEKTNQTIQAKNLADSAYSAKQAQKTDLEVKALKKALPLKEFKGDIEKSLTDKVRQYMGTSGKKAHDDYEKVMRGEIIP